MQWLNRKYKETLNYYQMNPYAYKFDSFVRSFKRSKPIDWTGVVVPFEPGLVSIILPAFNGEKMIAESLDSLLAQTYQNIEIIAINDGSSDRTGEILEEYARKDSRVSAYHQENLKIPKTLSRGMRMARGEFLTWTSIDNRSKNNCIEMLVGSLERNASWDMVYANIDIIDEHGEPLVGTDWYRRNQVPAGSEHIHLPSNTGKLNTWPNNSVGSAFLYRARTAWAMGDYSASRFLIEDYDYWMRVNELMTLRHTDFDDCIYDYRFHDESLTSKDKELGITAGRGKLMVFDEFRRSFYLSESIWVVSSDDDEAAQLLASSVKKELRSRGSIVFEAEKLAKLKLPRLWMPIVQIHCGDSVNSSAPLTNLPDTACQVYLGTHEKQNLDTDWDLFVTTESIAPGDLIDLEDGYRGWWSIPAISDFVTFCEIQAKNVQLSEIEKQAQLINLPTSEPEVVALSVVVCTYKRSATLENSLRSLVSQTLAAESFEIILVNNDPADESPAQVVETLRGEFADKQAPKIKIVDCPLPGLSYARNAGLSESSGAAVLYVDDDAIANPDCLEYIVDCFANSHNVGVVGGHIRLNVPEPKPKLLTEDRGAIWGQHLTKFETSTEVENWLEFPCGALWGVSRRAMLEIGGFRCKLGQDVNDCNGGEKLIASLLAKSFGYRILIEPRSEVIKDVAIHRFTEQQVKKTIYYKSRLNYKLHKELYLRPESNLLPIWKNYATSLRTRLRLLVGRMFFKSDAKRIEAFFENSYATGDALVFKEMTLDLLRRFRKPRVQKK